MEKKVKELEKALQKLISNMKVDEAESLTIANLVEKLQEAMKASKVI